MTNIVWPKYRIVGGNDDPGIPRDAMDFGPGHFEVAGIDPIYDKNGVPQIDRCKRVLEYWNKLTEESGQSYRYELVFENSFAAEIPIKSPEAGTW